MSDDIKEGAQCTWKYREIMAAKIAICQAGMQVYNDTGSTLFGPDDVPDYVKYGGSGIAGVAWRQLHDASIVTPTNEWRKSTREKAKGRRVFLYCLEPAHAISFLERVGATIAIKPMVQAAFAM